MAEPEILQIVPSGIHPDGLDAFHRADIDGTDDGIPNRGPSAETAVGILQRSSVGICHRCVVIHRSKRRFSGIQCRCVFPDDLDGGSGLTQAAGRAVHHQAGRLGSTATHQCFYLPGGRLHHDGCRLYAFPVPAVPVHFLFCDLLKSGILSRPDCQSATVQILPGVLLGVSEISLKIKCHLIDQRIFKIGQHIHLWVSRIGTDTGIHIIRQCGIALLLCDESLFHHIGQHILITVSVAFGIGQWVPVRGALDHRCQHSAFRQGQFRDVLSVVSLGSRFHSPAAVSHVDGIQIVLQNPLLGDLMLKTNSQILFLDLPLDLIENVFLLRPSGEEIVFHQLLSDGAGSLRGTEGRDVPGQCADDAAHINAVMMVKTLVLDGNDGPLQVIRDLIQRDIDSVGFSPLQFLDLLAVFVQNSSEILIG